VGSIETTVFDEERMAAELEGDRDLLYEVLWIGRDQIRSALQRLSVSDQRSQLQVAEEIATLAATIQARCVLEVASQIAGMDPTSADLEKMVNRLEREGERFLLETRLVL